jgi:ribonuclease VapC
MFIDSSVIVAILSRESDAAELSRQIETAACVTSALVILESVMRLSTKLRIDPITVEQYVETFLREAKIALAPMDGATTHLAIQAFASYGKGRGHKAQLNLADCLSYACAKAQNLGLLYKGKDFSYTDLA